MASISRQRLAEGHSVRDWKIVGGEACSYKEAALAERLSQPPRSLRHRIGDGDGGWCCEDLAQKHDSGGRRYLKPVWAPRGLHAGTSGERAISARVSRWRGGAYRYC